MASDIPTDVATIKQHIQTRREAVKILLSEIALLSERLRHQVGPVEWLKFQSTEAQKDNFTGENDREESQQEQPKPDWTLDDYLKKDQEWKDYLEQGKQQG